VYTVNNTDVDVSMTGFLRIPRRAFMKLGCEPAPLLLGFVLGPMMEENLRRAMLPVARRPDDIPHAADLSCDADRRGAADRGHHAARTSQQARGSFQEEAA
jgi:hypothetical protein